MLTEVRRAFFSGHEQRSFLFLRPAEIMDDDDEMMEPIDLLLQVRALSPLGPDRRPLDWCSDFVDVHCETVCVVGRREPEVETWMKSRRH